MISMCSQSAPHCSMNFASDARFAKSDDSIEGAILGCGSIRCNSSSFPPPMVDRSIDRWISSSFDPHLLVSQSQKKRKEKSFRGWLASSKTLGSRKSCDWKTFWSKRIPDQKPWKDDLFKNKTFLLARFQNNFSSSGRIFVFFFLVAALAGGIPEREKKALGFSDLKTCQSKLGEFFFFFFFFWGFFWGFGVWVFLFLFLLDFFYFILFSWVS